MPIENFPLLRRGIDAPYQPLLRLRIVNPDNGFDLQLYGLIDTGADECSLPGWCASKLGYELKAVQPKEVLGVGGSGEAYPHTCIIEVQDLSGSIVMSLGPCEFDFVDQWAESMAVIGVKNFLKDFVLTIDYPQKRFSIKRPRTK